MQNSVFGVPGESFIGHEPFEVQDILPLPKLIGAPAQPGHMLRFDVLVSRGSSGCTERLEAYIVSGVWHGDNFILRGILSQQVATASKPPTITTVVNGDNVSHGQQAGIVFGTVSNVVADRIQQAIQKSGLEKPTPEDITAAYTQRRADAATGYQDHR